MTALQAFGVGFLAVMFFGSFTLGLYLRRHDRLRREKPPPVKPPRKTLSNTEVAYQAGRMDAKTRLEKTVPTPEEALALVRLLDEYYAEVDRLCREYHRIAFHSGEDAAQAWMRKEIGQDKDQ